MSLAPPAPGRRAGGLPAAPLAPISLDRLLARRPDLGARILAHLRPRLLQAQARAQAALLATRGVTRTPAEVIAGWRGLIHAHTTTPIEAEAACGCAIAPEALALSDPADARQRIAALSPAQRVTQATVQAAWLAERDYPTTAEAILASRGDTPAVPDAR